MRGAVRPRASVIALCALAFYFLVQIIVRLSLPDTLELDEAEQVFLSQWLLMGYGPQPPLWNWLQALVFHFTGPSIFGLSLLKNLLLFACYLFYWMAADRLLKSEGLKVVAVLSLLTLPQVSLLPQQDLTHTVALLAATSLFLYAFARILAAPDRVAYAVAGLAVGLGVLAKYNFVLLPVAALIALLMDRGMRNRVLAPGMVLAVAIAVALVLPHGLWLFDNLGAATERTLAKMEVETGSWSLLSVPLGLVSLAGATIAFLAATALLYLAIFRRHSLAILGARTETTRALERMLLIMLIGLAVVILATGATHIRERWLDPFLLVVPLYLCLKVEAAGMGGRIARAGLAVIPGLIMLAIPAYLYGRVATASLTGDYTKLNLPFDALVGEIVRRQGGRPTYIVAADRHLAGNMRLHLPATPTVTTQFPEFTLPLPEESPVVLVWRSDRSEDLPAPLAKWMADHLGAAVPASVETLEIPYHYARGADRARFGYVAIDAARK